MIASVASVVVTLPVGDGSVVVVVFVSADSSFTAFGFAVTFSLGFTVDFVTFPLSRCCGVVSGIVVGGLVVGSVVGGVVTQDLVLHDSVSLLGPSSLQSFPPPLGSGLVHVRERILTPPPQLRLHSLKSLQIE